jgi:hypothetical protein
MKVRTLIEELSKLNGDLDLILQIDQEGNGYEEVRGIEECSFDGDSALHPDDLEEGVEYEKRAVIYP